MNVSPDPKTVEQQVLKEFDDKERLLQNELFGANLFLAITPFLLFPAALRPLTIFVGALFAGLPLLAAEWINLRLLIKNKDIRRIDDQAIESLSSEENQLLSIIKKICERHKIKMPEVYLEPGYLRERITSLLGRRIAVFGNSFIYQDEDEVGRAAAHELAHTKNKDHIRGKLALRAQIFSTVVIYTDFISQIQELVQRQATSVPLNLFMELGTGVLSVGAGVFPFLIQRARGELRADFLSAYEQGLDITLRRLGGRVKETKHLESRFRRFFRVTSEHRYHYLCAIRQEVDRRLNRNPACEPL